MGNTIRRCNMFQAARKHLDKARRHLNTAIALKGFSRKAMMDQLRLAETQLVMAELFIK
jgi:hypothetical protein